MSQCDHKTEAEYGVCNRCTVFAKIAVSAKKMLQARRMYMDGLLTPMGDIDELQYSLQDRVKDLEREVKFATDANLWD